MASKKKKLTLQESLFLKAYLQDGTKGFMNATESAIIAGYKCTTRESFCNIGSRIKRRLRPKIDEWIEEGGFNENGLKAMLLGLMNAKKTVLLKLKGKIKAEDLAEGVRIISEADTYNYIDKRGEYQKAVGETVIGVEVDNLELQLRSLDMAIKLRGMYAAEKVKVTGLSDLEERMTAANKRVKDKSD